MDAGVDSIAVANKPTLERARTRGRARISKAQNRLMSWLRRITSEDEAALRRNIGAYGEEAYKVGVEIGAAEAREEASDVHRQNVTLKAILVLMVLAGAFGWYILRC